jgi:ABC-type glycerol-3-phosphate transport system permease component
MAAGLRLGGSGGTRLGGDTRVARPIGPRFLRSVRQPWRAIPVVLATIWLLIVLVPLYYMVLATFRTQGDYLTDNPWIPNSLSFTSYTTVWDADLGRFFLNSVILAVVCIALTVTLCLGAAYRIVRRRSRWVGVSFSLMLFGLAIPIQAIIVPLYVLILKMHLYDTMLALILTLSAAAIPVSVLIMVSFVRDIPRELISAMLIDGGTEWTVFRQLIWPLSRPVMATLAIYNGLNVWNNFLLPLILTTSNSNYVLPLGLQKLQGEFSFDVPAMMAGVLLSTLPLVVLFIFMRRQVMTSLGGIVAR